MKLSKFVVYLKENRERFCSMLGSKAVQKMYFYFDFGYVSYKQKVRKIGLCF